MKFYSLFKWVALVCAIISVISFTIAVLRYFDNKPGDDAMEAYISTLQQSINSYEEDINTYNVKIDSLSKVQADIKKYYENKIATIKNASVASNIAIISEDSININNYIGYSSGSGFLYNNDFGKNIYKKIINCL